MPQNRGNNTLNKAQMPNSKNLLQAEMPGMPHQPASSRMPHVCVLPRVLTRPAVLRSLPVCTNGWPVHSASCLWRSSPGSAWWPWVQSPGCSCAQSGSRTWSAFLQRGNALWWSRGLVQISAKRERGFGRPWSIAGNNGAARRNGRSTCCPLQCYCNCAKTCGNPAQMCVNPDAITSRNKHTNAEQFFSISQAGLAFQKCKDFDCRYPIQGSNLAPARLPNAAKKSLGQAKLFPSLPCWQSHFKGPKFNILQLFPKTGPRRTLTGYPWNTRGSTHSDWPTCQAQRRRFWIQILSPFSVKRKGKYDSDCSESDSDVEWLTQLQEVLQLWTLSLPQSDFLV